MQVDEALGFADQWIEGVTVYEGLQGWRIVCATLAAEVRQLRSDLALAQGQRDASNREIERLRDENAGLRNDAEKWREREAKIASLKARGFLGSPLRDAATQEGK